MSLSYHEFVPIWKDLLSAGLQDDEWQWDWTTRGTLKDPQQKVHARIVAKSAGVWAANGLVEALNTHPSARIGAQAIKAKSHVADGGALKKGMVVCEWEGPARAILAFERPFLNLASYAGGIATQTAKLVSVVRKASKKHVPRVTSTRKTLPHYRDIAVYAVQAGGGFSHRISLAGGVLIKENHVAAAGGISRAIQGARAISPHGLRIEIEVRNADELAQALDARADVVMLDNFTPAQVRRAVKQISQAAVRPLVEISGGLNEKNIGDYAMEGVDVLSVGSLTHSVQSIDLSLLVE